MSAETPTLLVLANTVSPYLPELFDRVAARGIRVVLSCRSRGASSSAFAHETSGPAVGKLEVLGTGRARSALDAARVRPTAVILLGYTRPANLATAAWMRLTRAARVAFMGDTNACQLVEDLSRRPLRIAGLLAKRFVLRMAVTESLDLGWTNQIANRLLGIGSGVSIPLYAIDYERLGRPAARRWEHLRRPVLLSVARLVPEKNLVGLAQAWRRHIEAGGDGALVLVGEGPERQRLTAITRDLGGDRFELAGAIPFDRMADAYGSADGVVLASTREPWGIAVVEALGLGIPVLATDRVGSAMSLAGDAGGALRVCGSSLAALEGAVPAFVAAIDSARSEAERVSRQIRARFDMETVAERLAAWVTGQGVPTREFAR